MAAIDDEAAASQRHSDGNAAAPAALVVSLSAAMKRRRRCNAQRLVLAAEEKALDGGTAASRPTPEMNLVFLFHPFPIKICERESQVYSFPIKRINYGINLKNIIIINFFYIYFFFLSMK